MSEKDSLNIINFLTFSFEKQGEIGLTFHNETYITIFTHFFH
jgi:hypothetical protein